MRVISCLRSGSSHNTFSVSDSVALKLLERYDAVLIEYCGIKQESGAFDDDNVYVHIATNSVVDADIIVTALQPHAQLLQNKKWQNSFAAHNKCLILVRCGGWDAHKIMESICDERSLYQGTVFLKS